MNALRAMCRCGLAVVACALAAHLWLLSSARGVQPQNSGPSLVLLDGQFVAIESLQLANGKLSGDGVPDGLTLDDLRRIILPGLPNPVADKPAVVVELRGAGRILGKSVEIASDKCQIEWWIGEKLTIPIDVVRAIRFQPGAANTELDKAIAAPAADADRIFFQVDGKSDSVSGLIVGLTADELKFQLEGQERKLPRQQLVGIVVAQALADDQPARCILQLQDGSQLAGDLTSIAGDKATLALPGGSQLSLPWSAATSVQVRSNRVAFLSDQKPVEVEESALVTLPRPWQRDRSVMGKTLTIGSRTFDKGIGVHARSSLTFAAQRKYDVLAAIIGIDAETVGKGDCLFSVLGDGQSLFTKRMKGNDAPQEIQVEISRFDQVTLLVEPGEGLDLADHADWGDVRFIRKKQ